MSVAEAYLLLRIRAEYSEMPGLQLTLDQAQRLFGAEQALCKAVFEVLVQEQFLCVKANSAFARVTDEGVGRSPLRFTA